MEREFVIPLRAENLREEVPNQFWVISGDRIDGGERPESVIDDVAQRLANVDDENEGPLAIGESENFDALYYVMLHLSDLNPDAKTHLFDVISKGLNQTIASINQLFGRSNSKKKSKRGASQTGDDDMDTDDHEDPAAWKSQLFRHRTALKMYVWLIQWFASKEDEALVQKASTSNVLTSKAPAQKSKKAKTHDETQSPWENEDERTKFLSQLNRVLKSDLARLWGLPKPDEMFLGLFAKISFALLENATNHKSKHMKECIFAVLSTLVSRYQQTTEAVNLLIGLVKKSENFTNLVIDLTIAVVSGGSNGDDDSNEEDDGEEENRNTNKQDAAGRGAAFLGDVLVEISNLSYKELSTNNHAAKGCAAYVSSMANTFPKQTLPYISQLMTHLSGESGNMRSGIIEALGYLVHKAFAQFAVRTDAAEEIERVKANLGMRDQLLDILLQRFRDVTSWVRGRVLQTWAYLAENKAITKSFWQQVTAEGVGRLHDKAAHVRKCAIQLLQSLLLFNPFGSELKLTQFRAKCNEARQFLDQRTEGQTERLIEALENSDEAALTEMNLAPEAVKLANAYMMYRDGVKFIESMHQAMPDVSTLLGSKNVSDVQEAIRFFVKASDFYLENAKEGVRKMILLVATPQAEVKQAVIEAFISLYMNPPPSLSEDLHPLWVAKNLISWTLDASLGELTSLEELLGTMMNQNRITQDVVQTLWDIFVQKGGAARQGNDVSAQVQAAEGRGAIIILSMLASTDGSIIRQHLSDIVQVGLGSRAYSDPILAKWCCIALQKLAPTPQQQQQQQMQAQNQPAEAAAAPAPEAKRTGRGKKAAGAKKAGAKRGRRKNRDSDDEDDEAEISEEEDDEESTRAAKKKQQQDTAAGVAQEHVRFESTHKIFKKLTDLIESDRIPTPKWFGAAEQALNAIYLLAETPDKLVSELIKRMAAPLVPQLAKSYAEQVGPAENARKQRLQQQLKSQARDDDAMEVDGEDQQPVEPAGAARVDRAYTTVGQLARLLFVLGHCAMKQLVYMDAVVRHVKARNEAKEKKSAAAAAAAANRRGRKSMGGQQEEEQEAIEKELGVGNADPEDDAQRKLAEDAVVWNNLIGSFGNLVIEVCWNKQGTYKDPYLRFAAVNSLCKYMLVSESFCENNLGLLFSILSGKDAPTLRASIAIALGDLNVRFPNKIDEYREYFYGTLRDSNVNVRKNTLLVLTHLILHDMIKPKENISAMAMCLEDSEQRISDLARLFFYELAAKENAAAIYNIIPGLISGLSQVKDLPFESVQNIVRFLFSFIQKEKQLESLIDKLCQRFTHQEPKQAEYLAYCLSCLPNWSERGIKRMIENFPKFKDALNFPPVYEHFQSILTKARKNARAELKEAVDELEAKITSAVDPEKIEAAHQAAMAAAAARGETFEPETTTKRGRGRGAKRAGTSRTTAKRAGGGGRAKKAGRGRGRRYDDGDDEESEDDDLMDDSSEDDVEEAPRPRAVGKRAAAAKKAAPQSVADSDGDESDGNDSEAEKPKPAKRAAAKRAAARPAKKKKVESEDEGDGSDDDAMDVEPRRPAPRRGAASSRKVVEEDSDEDDDE